MNKLSDALRVHNITGTPAEIVKLLEADVVIGRDDQRWTYAGLAKRFGSEVVGQIDEGLRQIPGMDWVRLSLSSVGLDFSDPVTQAGLDGLKGKFPDETIAALKEIGVQHGPQWQAYGLDELPSEDAVAEAQSVVAFLTQASRAMTIIRDAVDAGERDFAALQERIFGKRE